VDGASGDDAYREIFATGEELAATALGTTADTVLPPDKIARARVIVEKLTGHIDGVFPTAHEDTIIGRCHWRRCMGIRSACMCRIIFVVIGRG
jgi:hypothetical protein